MLHLVPDPVTRSWIERCNPRSRSLHGLYAPGKRRSDTYAEMVSELLEPVRAGREVCAAFYGHPGVFARPGHEAIRLARDEGFPARMLPAVSALDCLVADPLVLRLPLEAIPDAAVPLLATLVVPPARRPRRDRATMARLGLS